jgi:hypothetical protein
MPEIQGMCCNCNLESHKINFFAGFTLRSIKKSIIEISEKTNKMDKKVLFL